MSVPGASKPPCAKPFCVSSLRPSPHPSLLPVPLSSAGHSSCIYTPHSLLHPLPSVPLRAGKEKSRWPTHPFPQPLLLLFEERTLAACTTLLTHHQDHHHDAVQGSAPGCLPVPGKVRRQRQWPRRKVEHREGHEKNDREDKRDPAHRPLTPPRQAGWGAARPALSSVGVPACTGAAAATAAEAQSCRHGKELFDEREHEWDSQGLSDSARRPLRGSGVRASAKHLCLLPTHNWLSAAFTEEEPCSLCNSLFFSLFFPSSSFLRSSQLQRRHVPAIHARLQQPLYVGKAEATVADEESLQRKRRLLARPVICQSLP